MRVYYTSKLANILTTNGPILRIFNNLIHSLIKYSGIIINRNFSDIAEIRNTLFITVLLLLRFIYVKFIQPLFLSSLIFAVYINLSLFYIIFPVNIHVYVLY